MTAKRHHWKEKEQQPPCGATLNDINAKLSVILELLEDRDSGCRYVPPDHGGNGCLEDDDNGDHE